MSEHAKVLRNSLIILALGASMPAAWAADEHPSSVPVQSASPAPTRTLDLKAPDIRKVMSETELNAPLPDTDEAQAVGPETVQVRGAPVAPYVPSGFAALYWAAVHPLSAWRIFTPVQ